MRDIVASTESTESSERILKLELGIRWEVGEAGAGGGLKAGDSMDSSILQIVSPLGVRPLLDAPALTGRTRAI
mgnify:CR=1 FL=1|jgi:hypothetical protein